MTLRVQDCCLPLRIHANVGNNVDKPLLNIVYELLFISLLHHNFILNVYYLASFGLSSAKFRQIV